jgi:cytochrome b
VTQNNRSVPWLRYLGRVAHTRVSDWLIGPYGLSATGCFLLYALLGLSHSRGVSGWLSRESDWAHEMWTLTCQQL